MCSGGKQAPTRTTRSYSSSSSSPTPRTSSYGSTLAVYVPDETGSVWYLDIMVVTAENLNVREGPGTSYAILYRLKRDEVVEYLATSGNWYKVRAGDEGITGFVHKDYLRFEQ